MSLTDSKVMTQLGVPKKESSPFLFNAYINYLFENLARIGLTPLNMRTTL